MSAHFKQIHFLKKMIFFSICKVSADGSDDFTPNQDDGDTDEDDDSCSSDTFDGDDSDDEFSTRSKGKSKQKEPSSHRKDTKSMVTKPNSTKAGMHKFCLLVNAGQNSIIVSGDLFMRFILGLSFYRCRIN